MRFATTEIDAVVETPRRIDEGYLHPKASAGSRDSEGVNLSGRRSHSQPCHSFTPWQRAGSPSSRSARRVSDT